ncbi:MAG TPA: putative glycoside hydrolase [Candidatus Eisenbacteria bacterium]|nr:putative glycoside hydrolase [Candidatus Eisenbacteria bacterium]
MQTSKLDARSSKLKLNRLLARYGALAAFAAAIPAVAYLVVQPGPAERFRPLFMAERPGSAAVRADLGPAGPLGPTEAEHVTTPAFVKGIYVSADTAAAKRRFAQLVDLVDRTELNAMVIDVKDGRGALAFAPESEALKPFASERPQLGELRAFTGPLHEKGIYLIARVFVFQDPWLVSKKPEYAVQRLGGGVWRDRRGTPWMDPASRDVWKYNAAVAKEVYAAGFDEVQFDYIRFLSDGNLSTAVYPAYDRTTPKSEVIASFFGYMDAELREKHGIPISADLFGLTMDQHEYDLGIGQRLEPAARHFDFVSPMVYPSHYASGYQGFANPAAHPYEVARHSIMAGWPVLDALKAEDDALRERSPGLSLRIGTIRPWLQDFDLGAHYTAEMVRGQMKAAIEGKASGWLFWNAKNVYTEAAYAPAGEEGDTVEKINAE